MKKKLFATLLIIAMVFSLAACNSTPAPSSAPPAASSGEPSASAPSSATSAPVEIAVAFSVVPNGLDPISEDVNTTISVANHFYDRLVEIDMNLNQVPGVAKTWKQVDDYSWEFEINLDFKFQNGEPLTMDDVVYSVERLANIAKSADIGAVTKSVTYEGNILTITLTEHDNSVMPRLLAVSHIVNKAYMESGGDDALIFKPIGTGPYKVTEFTPGASVVLETWDGYPFQKPQIDKITITAIADNSNRYIAVESGQLQYAGLVSAMEIQTAEKNSNLSTYEAPSNLVIPFGFNCQRPPFDNVNVRRGIIHAMNLKEICALNGGRRGVGSILFAGFDDVYVDSPGFPEFDLDKARELLEAEGISPANPLTMETLYFRPDPGIELFQSDLKTVGVELVTNLVEFSVFLVNEGGGNFDGLWTSNPNRGGHWLPDLDRLDYDNFLGMRNLCRWRNERVQEIISILRTTNDQQVIKDLTYEINEIIGYEVPIVGVFLMPILCVMDKGLTGIEVLPNLQQNFRNATYNP